MSDPEKVSGEITAAIQAGHIEATATKPNHIGQQLAMAGSGIHIYITPDVARQWIGVLTPIAEESNA